MIDDVAGMQPKDVVEFHVDAFNYLKEISSELRRMVKEHEKKKKQYNDQSSHHLTTKTNDDIELIIELYVTIVRYILSCLVFFQTKIKVTNSFRDYLQRELWSDLTRYFQNKTKQLQQQRKQ